MTPHMPSSLSPALPSSTLVVKTDLQGHITYANPAFVATTGYAPDELLGQLPHMVRHPDIPAALLGEIRQALQNGSPWQGTVKLLCKDGSAFWSNACLVPIRRHEQPVGHMAVLRPAEPAAITAAQQHHAQIATHGLPGTRQLSSLWGVRAGVRAGTLVVAVLMLAGGVLGIGGLKLSDAAFARLYHEQFEPATAVGQVEAQLSEVRSSLLAMQLGASAAQTPDSPRRTLESLQNSFDEIHEIFGRVPVLGDHNSSASMALAKALQQYTSQARALITPAAGSVSLDAPLQQQILELENKASLTAHALRQALTDSAQQGFSETLQRNDRIRTLAMFGIVLGLLAIAVIGQLFVRSIVNPLNTAIHRLNRIAEGDLQGDVELSGTGETARLNQAAVIMQQHLRVMIDEIALAARRIQQHCLIVNQSLHEVTQHSEAQHDQVHAAIRSLQTAVEETCDLSLRAERLMYMAAGAENTSGDVTTTLEHETRELATATRLTAFGAEEVAGAMRQVAHLIVENRGQAQLAWQASEELMHTARELNQLIDFFEPHRQAQPHQPHQPQ